MITRLRKLLIGLLALIILMLVAGLLTPRRPPTHRQLDQALFAAIDHNDPAKVIALLNKGAKPNSHPVYYDYTDNRPSGSLWHRALQWLQGRERRQLRIDTTATPLQAALDERYVLHDLCCEQVWSPKSPVIARTLIERGADVNARITIGLTPLMYVVYAMDGPQHHNLVKLLLDGKADVNAQSNGYPVLVMAIQNGSPKMVEVVKMLLERGADVNARQMGCWTPLMIATTDHKTDMVESLLAHHADVDAKSNFGDTALSLARAKHYTDIVRLLEKADAGK